MTPEQSDLSLRAFAFAIEKAKGQVALAMILGCSQSRVSRIRDGESSLDAEMAARIDKALKVPKYDLRPDLFDPPKGTKRDPNRYDVMTAAEVVATHQAIEKKSRAAKAGTARRKSTRRKNGK